MEYLQLNHQYRNLLPYRMISYDALNLELIIS